MLRLSFVVRCVIISEMSLKRGPKPDSKTDKKVKKLREFTRKGKALPFRHIALILNMDVKDAYKRYFRALESVGK